MTDAERQHYNEIADIRLEMEAEGFSSKDIEKVLRRKMNAFFHAESARREAQEHFAASFPARKLIDWIENKNEA